MKKWFFGLVGLLLPSIPFIEQLSIPEDTHYEILVNNVDGIIMRVSQ
ncbi:hypothetical protein [Paenibacillus sp. Marseille-Q4541]|nr:hypothetical protein [Paenibacillus sp. Marseille-Q4541]